MVEAAIVMPMLLLVLFGILEYGMMFRTSLTMSEATRAAARVAVAKPRLPGYHETAAAAASGSLTAAGITDGQLGVLVIYRADPATGGLESGGATNADIEAFSVDCWHFDWDPVADEYKPRATPTWAHTQQFACGLEGETDYLGVYLRGTHHFMTDFFKDEQVLTERTIYRLEPFADMEKACKPGA